NSMAEIRELEIFEQITGIKPDRTDLYTMALTHKSTSEQIHYERLEFLGDSILSMLSAEYVFNKYADSDEGMLTKERSKIVNRQSLASVFDELGFDRIIIIDRKSFPERIPRSIKEDVIEALIAAVYLDRGMEYARQFFKLVVDNAGEVSDFFFAKNNLQELTMEIYRELPEFRVYEEDGKFTCRIYLQGEFIATASADSKKNSEKKAALIAYNKLKKEF
ncbi:MAG: ribonuclease III domain-containing protein, partial [bacterium]